MISRRAVLADVHSNAEALETVLSDAEARGVEEILFLGDALGYGPAPLQVLRRLAATVTLDGWVIGNHDEGLGRLRASREAKGEEMAEHETAGADLEVALTGLSGDALKAMRINFRSLRRLPRDRADVAVKRPTEQRIDSQIHLVHGGLRANAPTITYTDNVTDATRELEVLAGQDEPVPRWCLYGHTHRPAAFHRPSDAPPADPVRRIDLRHRRPIDVSAGRWLVNPGSVGQPRDGDPRASYLILDLAAGTAELIRLEYRVEVTQKQMENLDMPRRLIQRLARGH